MDPDQHMGALYPFSLNQKLAKITETSPWYSDAKDLALGPGDHPAGDGQRAGRILEPQAKFPVKGPAVGLFADQEIRMIEGPLFVGEDLSDPPRDRRPGREQAHRVLLGPHAHLRRLGTRQLARRCC
jgi:hypothetical protein